MPDPETTQSTGNGPGTATSPDASAPQVTSTDPAQAPVPAGVHLLDRARALEEIAKEEVAELIGEGIQAFKDLEGRTMKVVHRFGQLFKQEV